MMLTQKLRQITWLVVVAALLFLSSCNKQVSQTADGVTIHYRTDEQGEAQVVRLQVVTDAIVRVSACPGNNMPKDSSLIIVPSAQERVYFKVAETDSNVTLTTAALEVVVNLKNRNITFADTSGNVYTQAMGNRTDFKAITIEGKKGYEMRQMFDSPASALEEGFYGLGQHQSDELNYRGRNEGLYQYNTKVSVPFILSNRGYGILWDNNSLSRYGDQRDYAQLYENFTLKDAQGNVGGLSAIYVGADGVVVEQVEDSICYEDIKSIKKLPTIERNGANVTYKGSITPKESGEYNFYLYYAGYITLKINGEEVVPERWRTAWNPNAYKFPMEMREGVELPIEITWKPDGGESYIGLRALSPVAPEDQDRIAFFSEMGQIMDYYFIAGANMDQVVSGYRTLTGKAPIMPKWAMGFWQSRERYKTSDEMLGALAEFRERQIPIDNIVLDWNHWYENAWGSHDFDLDRFPDPKGMVDSIHALNGRMMVSIWPKFYETTEHFKEFDQQGWMYRRAVEDSIKDWVGPGYVGSFYDAYSADARKLFWQQIYEHYYPLNIDAWWMDASEPNVRDCTDMEYRKALCGPTALGPSTEYFNAYALMNAEAIYDGQRSVDPDKRVFLLTRSGFSGLQRYSTATWSGDIATRWEDMKAQITCGQNFSVSGIPWWSMDVGGFCVEKRYEAAQHLYDATKQENADMKEWRELNTRWYQFGAFTPLFRVHGQYPYREPFNLAPEGHPAYKSMVEYIKLRYKLMPYVYSMAGMTHFDDYTIMRPMVMDFPTDVAVLDLKDQYMFGPAFMVCPVYEYGARSREVYFPEGGWYDFYNNHYIAGGETQMAEAPYEKMPLYVRAGSIIPMGAEIEYVDQVPTTELTLYVYDGANGAFALYEDEGVNYNYEKGNYQKVDISYDNASKRLNIGERQGGHYNGEVSDRVFDIVFIQDGSKSTQRVNYNGNAQSIALN